MSLSLNIIKTVLVGTGSSFCARSLQFLANVISIPIIISSLGSTASYGIWVTITAVFSVLSLSDLGLNNSLARLIARARGKGLSIGRLIKTIFFAEIAVGLVIILLTIVISIGLPEVIARTPEEAKLIAFAILMRGFAEGVVTPLRLSIPILTGHQKYGLHVVGDTLSSLLILIGVSVVSQTHSLDYYVLAIITATSLIFGALAGCVIAAISLDDLKIKSSKPDLRYLRAGFDFGKASLGLTASVAVSLQGTTIILSVFGEPEWAAIWALASLVTLQVSHLGSGATAPFTTYASQMNKKDNFQEILAKATGYVSISMVSLIASVLTAVYLFGPGLLRIIVPTISRDNQGEQLILVLVSLLFALALSQPFYAARGVLLGTRKHWSIAKYSIFSSVLGLLVIVLTIPVIKIWGAVLGRWIFLLLPTIFLYLPATLRILGDKKKNFFSTFIVMFLWPITIGLSLTLAGFHENSSLLELIIRLTIYIILLFIGATALYFGYKSSKHNFP